MADYIHESAPNRAGSEVAVKRRRPLFVDGRRAQGIRTGVGHYTLSLLRAFPEDDSVRVLGSRGNDQVDLHLQQELLPSGPIWHVRAWLKVIASRGAYLSTESLIVPMLVGRRAVITIHDLTPLDAPGKHKRRNVAIHKLFMRRAVSRVGAIVVPSEAVRRDLVRWFPRANDKTVVIHEGVRPFAPNADLPDPALGHLVGQKYILYVGTIEPRKNVPTLIQAFLDAGLDDWHLVLAGKTGWISDRERDELKTLIDKNRNVHQLGFVPDGWLPWLFQNAALFAYISDAEGFGLPVAEAMHAGTPVLHTDDPALVEVGGGAGIVVSRANLRSDTVRELVRFSGLPTAAVDALLRRGKQNAERFSWEAAAESTVEVIERAGQH